MLKLIWAMQVLCCVGFPILLLVFCLRQRKLFRITQAVFRGLLLLLALPGLLQNLPILQENFFFFCRFSCCLWC